MNKLVPLASAILFTVASSTFATAELKLDTRHDIAPVATHATPPAAQTTEAPRKLLPPPQSRVQVADADHQASATTIVPAKPKVQRKARPRYVEQPVFVVRPVFRPIRVVRFGRW